MSTDFIRELIKGLPNLAGLVILAYVLWLIQQDTVARLDRQFEFLVACLQASGVAY